MNYSVKGITSTKDEHYKRMKAIYDNCITEEIAPPDEVLYDYFDGEIPDERGIVIDLEEHTIEWQGEDNFGIEISLAGLPKNITTIRVYID